MADALSDFTQLSQAFGNMANSLISLMNVKTETEVNRRQAEIGKLQTDFLMRLSLPPGSIGRISSQNFMAEFDSLNARTQEYIDSVDDSFVKSRVQNILSSSSNTFKLKVAEKYSEALYNEAMNNYFVTNEIEYQNAPGGKKEETAMKLLEWGRANMEPSEFKKYESGMIAQARADDAYSKAVSSGEYLSTASLKVKLDPKAQAIFDSKVQSTIKATDDEIDKIMEDNQKALDSGDLPVDGLLDSVRLNPNLSVEKRSSVIDKLTMYQSQNIARKIGTDILAIGHIDHQKTKWRSPGQISQARDYIAQQRKKASEDSPIGVPPKPILEALEKADNEVATWERELAEKTATTDSWLQSQWNNLVDLYNNGAIRGIDLYSFIRDTVEKEHNRGELGARFRRDIMDKNIIRNDAHREALAKLGPLFDSTAKAMAEADNRLFMGLKMSKGAQKFLKEVVKGKVEQFKSDVQSMLVSIEARYMSGNLKDLNKSQEDIAKYLLVYAETMSNIGTVAIENLKGSEGDIGKILNIAEGGLGAGVSYDLFENTDIFGQSRGQLASFNKLKDQVRTFGIASVQEAISAETLPADALRSFKATKLVESKDTVDKVDTAFESADGKYRIDINKKDGGGTQMVLSRSDGSGAWKPIQVVGRSPTDELRIVEGDDPESRKYQRWDGRAKKWVDIDKEMYDSLSGIAASEGTAPGLRGY